MVLESTLLWCYLSCCIHGRILTFNSENRTLHCKLPNEIYCGVATCTWGNPFVVESGLDFEYKYVNKTP